MKKSSQRLFIAQTVIKIFVSTIIVMFSGCGTLGGGNIIRFNVSKENLNIAFDSLYLEYPKYKIPEKWNKYNDWSKRGYDFLESRIIYFNATPPLPHESFRAVV